MATFLYYGEFAHWGYCENWIASALDRNGHHCLRVQRNKWFDESRLISIAAQHQCDYLLISKAPEIHPEQLETIRRQTGMKIIWWTFDWMRHPNNINWYLPLAKVSDICFQTDGKDDAFYSDNGIKRVELHQGADPLLHDYPINPSSHLDLASDVIFIGSSYTERRRDLLMCLDRFKGFRKWGVPERQVWGNEFASACYLSRIVVGDNFVNDVPGYWSDRVYLTLACGGFFLTAYVEGMEDVFENHRHLVWWKTFDELQGFITHYMAHESQRRAIALEGYNLVHEKHTYDHRIIQMTKELNRL